jgi:hypothetical protein
LDLSYDYIGDLGIDEICKELNGAPCPLEEVDMSGNDIGKSSNNFAKMVPNMILFLNHFGRLHTFKIGHNNMKGGQGVVDKLLLSFADMAVL